MVARRFLLLPSHASRVEPHAQSSRLMPQCPRAIPGCQVLRIGLSEYRPRTLILFLPFIDWQYSAVTLTLTCPDNDVQKQYLESGQVSEYVGNVLTNYCKSLGGSDSFTFHIPRTRVNRHAHNVKFGHDHYAACAPLLRPNENLIFRVPDQ